jgi:hypothetical protein
VTERKESAGGHRDPIPRDLPDQQAREGEDPWEVAPGSADPDADGTATDVPDTDEAGTGRQGAPQKASPNPEHPVPDESPA